jgi:hypothetical protein
VNEFRHPRYLILFVLIAVAAGCSTTVSVEEFKEYINDRKAQRLAVQVCLPDRKAFFDELSVDVTDMPADVPYQALAKMFGDARANKKYTNPYMSASTTREYEAIRQWRMPTSSAEFPKQWIGFGKVDDVKGIVSGSGETAYLADSTESNQAVFFAFTHERLCDVIAIHVHLPMHQNGKTERITYWFKPPRDITTNGYTEWIAPVSEEGPNEQAAKLPTFWLLTHGKEMPIYRVGDNAPRIRYALLSNEEYWKVDKDGRRAMYSVRLQHLTDGTSVDDDRIHLVPAKRAGVPPC